MYILTIMYLYMFPLNYKKDFTEKVTLLNGVTTETGVIPESSSEHLPSQHP